MFPDDASWPQPSLQCARLTVTGCVAAVAYLMKSDVRTGAATFRRNIKHIRGWLEEQSAAASEYAAHCDARYICFLSASLFSVLSAISVIHRSSREEVKKVTDAAKKVKEGSKPSD